MVYSLIGTFHTITEISNCLPHPFSLFSFSTRTLEFHGAHDLVMTTFPGLLCIKLVQEVVRLTSCGGMDLQVGVASFASRCNHGA